MGELADFEAAIADAAHDVLPECDVHERNDGEPYCEYIGVAVAARVVAAPLDAERLGRALHEVYCRGHAPMHSHPLHSAAEIAAAYNADSR